MKSTTSSQFWKHYQKLPLNIQQQADKTYRIWRLNPNAHSLYFKRLHTRSPMFSVRVGRGYRALGLVNGATIVWFWIGTHDEYERLLKQL